MFLAVAIFEFSAFMITLEALIDYVDTDDPISLPAPVWLSPSATIFMSPMIRVCYSWENTFSDSTVWIVGAMANALIWASVVTSIWMGIVYLRRRWRERQSIKVK